MWSYDLVLSKMPFITTVTLCPRTFATVFGEFRRPFWQHSYLGIERLLIPIKWFSCAFNTEASRIVRSMLGNPVRSNPLGVVFPKSYFTTPPRPMHGWLTAHLRAVCPPFSLRTNRIDGKADFICIATTAAELLPIGPLAYTQFGWACSGWNHRSPDQDLFVAKRMRILGMQISKFCTQTLGTKP